MNLGAMVQQKLLQPMVQHEYRRVNWHTKSHNEMEEPEEEIGNHHDVSGLGFHHTGQYAEYITVKLSKILLSQ